MFVNAGLFDVCIYVCIQFSYVCMYMLIGLFYVRKYMYIGLFSVCRICGEKNGKQLELQRKVMTECWIISERESARARERERLHRGLLDIYENIYICACDCVCVCFQVCVCVRVSLRFLLCVFF